MGDNSLQERQVELFKPAAVDQYTPEYRGGPKPFSPQLVLGKPNLVIISPSLNSLCGPFSIRWQTNIRLLQTFKADDRDNTAIISTIKKRQLFLDKPRSTMMAKQTGHIISPFCFDNLILPGLPVRSPVKAFSSPSKDQPQSGSARVPASNTEINSGCGAYFWA